MIYYFCKHITSRKKVLDEVEVGNAIADRTEKSRSVLNEDKITLLIHGPHKIGELLVTNMLRIKKVPESLTSLKQSSTGTLFL